MSAWNEQLKEAEEKLDGGYLRDAFLTAFGALEICFSAATQKPRVKSIKDREDSFGIILRGLREQKKIGEEEYQLADHLRDARNVVAHKFGFEPSEAEVRRTITKVRRLCARFGKCVSEVMSKPVITTCPDDLIGNLIAYFVGDGISLLPVVENGEVVGTLRDTAVLKAWEDGEGILDPNTPVRHLMDNVILPEIRPNASIQEAKDMMIRNHTSALLVLNSHLPVGIITKFDLLLNLGSVM